MTRSLVLVLVAVLALPAAAAAKGPTAAEVTGPGIATLAVRGAGEGGAGTPLGSLVENAGFFPSYTRPDQTFWGGERTRGGWYVATGSLTTEIGLPATPPGDGGSDVRRRVGVAAAGAALLGLALALLLRRRPRKQPAPA
jgi:hypothetical protein